MELANLSTVYIQIGDMAAARIAAEQALRGIGASAARGTREQLLCNLGTALAAQGNVAGAERALTQAIDAAAESGPDSLLAQAFESRAEERLRRGALPLAEADLLAAYGIQAPRRDLSLAATLCDLSALREKQGDLRSAWNLIQSAIATRGGALPLWELYFREGSVLAKLGRDREALADYRRAVAESRAWREEIAPSDSLRTGAAGHLNELYSAYIEELMAKRRNAAEAFGATEECRAAALRQTLSSSPAWRTRLPDDYWQTLNRLRTLEMQPAAARTVNQAADVERLQARMNEIEARVYTHSLEHIPSSSRENFLPRNTLSDIQRRLHPEELLLSFHFGHETSYLWAVTRSRVEMRALGPSDRLKGESESLAKALEADSAEGPKLGALVYRELLGSVSAPLLAKKEWIVAADDITIRLPWNALREPIGQGHTDFVVERHSVRYIPSALSLGARAQASAEAGVQGLFLGVGDGVYNRADPRQKDSGSGFNVVDAQAAVELPRLVGSGRELEECARAWGGHALLLTGVRASRGDFVHALAGKPAIIHFATHVLETNGAADPVIHLGLAERGAPQVLTHYDIANLSVEGSTVVISGCRSVASPAPLGAGLLGLARAWLIAGARSVVGSRWAAPDDGSGTLYEAFYGNLRRGRSVSAALRRAELDMLRSGSWRARPRYWASFIVVGKE